MILGHVIIITAIPYGKSEGTFVVRFTEGSSKKEALHFRAKFGPNNVVITNAMNNDLRYAYKKKLLKLY